MIRYNIHFCDKCHLGIFNGFTPVCGQGEGRDIMIVGEAPGVTEKTKGEPFVGKSGKLLKKYLNHYGLSEHSYITNVVKCRPPANRKPRDIEIASCRGYLLREIAIVKPKMIILLGATAINFMYPNVAYVKERAGRFKRHGKVIVGCYYHPSYILQNKEKEVNFKEFFANCADIYNYLNPYFVKNYLHDRIKKSDIRR